MNVPSDHDSPALSETIALDELNQAQYEAVTTVDGPVLVIAGAGSGKTRTLVYRVAHLLEQGVPPEQILLLTFTRKASQEMLFRAGQLLNDSCSRVVGGTFHGVANMLLRRYGSHLGFGSSFTITDRGDAEGIINLLKSSLGLSGRDRQFPSKRVLVNIISGAVNRSMDIEDLIFSQYAHLSDHADDILRLARHYAEFKFNHGLMDYDDLLINWKRLLAEVPEARQGICSRYSHIMVDEYQDTNQVQAEIVRLLAHGHDNVMVVGDDSQSIYSFRGADFYNIMRFPKVFSETKIIKLEENYRSTQPILSLTNDIIRNAVDKYTKTLFTRIEGDRRPCLFAADNEREEASFVVRTIGELQAKGVDLKEVAVLFRSGFHSYKLEMELGSRGVDFEKRGGLKLTEAAHMKDMIAFFRVLVNPRDNMSWTRIFLHLDKVGPKTAQKISDHLGQAADPFVALARYPAGKSWQAGMAALVNLMTALIQDETASQIYERVRNYYQPIFERLFRDDYPKREKDLDQLKGIVSEYDDLQKFVDDTTLDPPESASRHDLADQKKLVISTIHSSKGLEWDNVFVIGLADGRFPHASALPGEQWEEERRLLYVAATRARQRLYLTYPRELMTPDRQFRRVGMSPFLAELLPGLMEDTSKAARSRTRSTGFGAGGGFGSGYDTDRKSGLSSKSGTGSKGSRSTRLESLAVGNRVKHPFFGFGEVKKSGVSRSVDVEFERHGLKTLHLDYAKLTIVE
ncbi:MAG: ATP-dependent helicase [Desulfobulbaceae bacterium]|uniref:DNA 3'-5' helicase n=1 Tax=Candidatus Desulfatifera sulfidica TaxID=2841691 RepID=A0A8J6N6T6_9BACT|nr:ATP-dependent helicase [Candidatus Desulfatifera sulfidica]